MEESIFYFFLVTKNAVISGIPSIPTIPNNLNPTIIATNVANGCKPKSLPTNFGSMIFLITVMIIYKNNNKILINKKARKSNGSQS